MTPIRDYLLTSVLSRDNRKTQKMAFRAKRFLPQDGVLYKLSFTHPLLGCLSKQEADDVLNEIHSGICGDHIGAHTGIPSVTPGILLANFEERCGEISTKLQRMPVLCTDVSSPGDSDDTHRIADPLRSVGDRSRYRSSSGNGKSPIPNRRC